MEKKIIFLLIVLFNTFSFAQTELVFVFFKDKPNKNQFYADPKSELSQKSLDRRTALNISLIDEDAPIEPSYLSSLQSLGYDTKNHSKWLNGVALLLNSQQATQIKNLPFVARLESFVRHQNSTVVTRTPPDKFEKIETPTAKNTITYGESDEQISQINLKPLHNLGYTGVGIRIAVIDSGFPTVDTGSAFDNLRSRSKIINGYNFVNKSTDIYNKKLSNHGTVVLGTMGGFIDSKFVGSAPDAEYLLYSSEDTSLESPIEEIYWAMAAEQADREGADIITTSLGYSQFEDSRYNYEYSDMTGNVSFIGRTAQKANEKGIIVLVSNGNAGQQTWKYLLAPADNAKVFSVGAVTSTGTTSSFTSYGPSASGVIKPDAAARGTSTVTVYDSFVVRSSGTSFSTPLSAGGIACLLQSLPKNQNRDKVLQTLRETASLYPKTSSQIGYGILNFGRAYEVLKNNSTENADTKIYFNRYNGFLTIQTSETLQNLSLYDMSGKLIKQLPPQKYHDVNFLLPGTYLMNIQTDKSSKTLKFLKNK